MKPMLAYTVEDVKALRLPVLASPKLDGIRCLLIDGKAYSRNLKLIPNAFIQDSLAGLHGLDGELIVGNPRGESVFTRTTSGVMRRDGEPKFNFYAFDTFTQPPEMWFQDRIKLVKASLATGEGKLHPFCAHVPHKLIKSMEALLEYEARMLLAGYEGIMVRSLDGPYKHGRSTAREGYLGKIKRFTDGEARIIGFDEQMHNANEAKKDALGRTERSSHKENKHGKGTLGALKVQGLHTGVKFDIGTGFDDRTRAAIWADRKGWLGKIIKYKSQPTGVKEKPRFPVYLGLREDL